ncbi:hypothetical protein ACVQIH_26775, partial [Klebsiella pneumoniae]
EQEGQLIETEATGAPQKHHHTLNQQVGSITDFSAGIIEYDEKIHTECSAIMQDADERMYEIKKGKR